MVTCPFYVQYVEDPQNPCHFKIHNYYDKHRHSLGAGFHNLPDLHELSEHFLHKRSKIYCYKERTKTPFRNSVVFWKHHYLRSVEYELTVIHGEEFQFKHQEANQSSSATPMTIEQSLCIRENERR
jgi:hypothetical protein